MTDAHDQRAAELVCGGGHGADCQDALCQDARYRVAHELRAVEARTREECARVAEREVVRVNAGACIAVAAAIRALGGGG